MTYICPELPGKYFDIIFYLRVDDKYLPGNFQANILILYRNFETVDENIYKWSSSELLLALKDNMLNFSQIICSTSLQVLEGEEYLTSAALQSNILSPSKTFRLVT